MHVVLADMKYLTSYHEFLSECSNSGIIKYSVAREKPKVYLEKVIAAAHEDNLKEQLPPTSTYFCIKNEEVLGAIRYRHGTNTFIERVIGQTGYETKPSARGKGVARFMLSWLQKNILTKDIIITCEADNIASQKVIESCGAQYLNQIFSNEKNSYVSRFQLRKLN